MQNLRLLFLGGLFLILCTKNANSMEQLTPLEEHTRVTDIGNAILNEDYLQVNNLLINDRSFINRQNEEGETPLYILLSSPRCLPKQVAYLLAHGADGLQELELAGNIKTPLYAAAHLGRLNKPERMLILKLLVKKKLIDELNLNDTPPNPHTNALEDGYAARYSDSLTQRLCAALEDSNYTQANLEAYISGLPMQLRFEITPGTYANPEEYNNSSSVYKDVLSWSNNSLQAYMHVKDLNRNIANWDICFKAFDSKNLLQLAGDRANIRLIRDICNCKEISVWNLYFSSRQPGTNPLLGPPYKSLGKNPDIGKCYRRCLESGVVFVVGVMLGSVVLPKAGSYLIDLVFK